MPVGGLIQIKCGGYKEAKEVLGYLSIKEIGLMAFKSELINLQFLVSEKLLEIKNIISQDGGYAVIDTNYGEEYVDIDDIVDSLKLDIDLSDLQLRLEEA